MWILGSLLNSKVYFSIPRHSACCKDCPGAGEGAASLKSLNWLFKLKIERERESRYELSSMLMLISWTAGAILLQRARPCLHPQRAACSNKGVRNGKDVPDVLCVQDGAVVFFFDLRMKDFYFKLRENWLIQHWSQLVDARANRSSSPVCTDEISGGTTLAFSIRSSTVGNSSFIVERTKSLRPPLNTLLDLLFLIRSDDPWENGWPIEGRRGGHWLMNLRHGVLLAGAHLWPSACRARTLREVGLGIGKILQYRARALDSFWVVISECGVTRWLDIANFFELNSFPCRLTQHDVCLSECCNGTN